MAEQGEMEVSIAWLIVQVQKTGKDSIYCFSGIYFNSPYQLELFRDVFSVS